MKHGERTAERIAARRELADFMRLVREDDRLLRDEARREAAALAGVDPADVWLGRIAGELDPQAGAGRPTLRIAAAPRDIEYVAE